jgi:hypothetical protein
MGLHASKVYADFLGFVFAFAFAFGFAGLSWNPDFVSVY